MYLLIARLASRRICSRFAPNAPEAGVAKLVEELSRRGKCSVYDFELSDRERRLR